MQLDFLSTHASFVTLLTKSLLFKLQYFSKLAYFLKNRLPSHTIG